MQRPFFVSSVSLLCIVAVVGCGGGLSQADLKKYAIRRKKDDAPSPSSPTAAQFGNERSKNSSKSQPGDTAAKAATDPTADESSADSPSAEQQESGPAVAASASPFIPVGRLTDTKSPPSSPLSEAERRQISAQNLERIAAGMKEHLKQRGVFPNYAFVDSQGTPILSWRVALLPYLGYQDLYNRFELDEPWYSEHNKRLIEKIPSVFQSPERFDSRTNYLVPVGGATAFQPARKKGIHPRRVEDGLENTVIVIEADDALAVTWTEPQEFEFRPQDPLHDAGQLRGGDVYLIWGEGLVGSVTASTGIQHLKAMFTTDVGEAFAYTSVNRPISLGVAPTGNLASVTSSSDASNQGSNGATGRRPVGNGHIPGRASSVATPLASEYLSAAERSSAAGVISNGIRWFLAAASVSPPHSGWHEQYRWVPGLRRPMPAITFAVGVDYSGGGSRRGSAKSASNVRQSNAREDAYRLTEPFGPSMLGILEAHALEFLPASAATALADTTRAGGRHRKSKGAVKYYPLASRSESVGLASDKLGQIIPEVEEVVEHLF